MALIIKDRVKETTTTTGTGTVTLSGASTGFRSFADIGNANTTYYTIAGGSEWEVGLGTYTASGTTLSRDTVLSNSLGTTAKISFSDGSKDVFCTYPSGVAVTNVNPTDITINGRTVGKGAANYDNLAIGQQALFNAATTGTRNVGLGYSTLYSLTTGVDNIAIGYNSQTLVTTGSNNIAIGTTSLYNNITGSNNVAIGNILFNVNSDNNIGIGTGVGGTISKTIGIGSNVALTTGAIDSIFFGYNAGNALSNADNAVVIGSQAFGLSAGVTNYSVVIGKEAYGATTGSSGDGSIAIGYQASYNSNTAIQTVIGYQANFSATSRGNNCTAIGYQSLYSNGVGAASSTLSASNTAIGHKTLFANTTGRFNTALGHQAGWGAAGTNANTTGASNTYIGYQTVGSAATNSNETVIGASAVGLGSGTTVIGSTGVTSTTIYGALQSGTNVTASSTTNIATGATGASNTNAINIGTGGAASSTTTIGIGSTAGTSTTTVNGAVTLSATTQDINIGNGQSSGAINIGTAGSRTGAINIGTGSGGLGTGNITIGTSTGQQTITLGRSTGSSTTNIGTGTNGDGQDKNINIGTNSGTGNTQIIIGTNNDFCSTVISSPLYLSNIVYFNGSIKQTPIAVSALPVVGYLAEAGDRNVVNNALNPRAGSVVVGGGSETVVVYCDGTNWICDSGLGTTTGSNNVVLSTSPTIAGLIAAAGTTTVPSLKLTNGTNLTTTTAGAIEYDGSAFYNSVAASTRGVMPSEQIVILDTAYTLTSQTAAQKLFNASTNGAVTLPVGTYQFECQFALSSLATPSAFGFAMVAGTAVIGAQGWTAIAAKGTALTSPSAATISFNTAPSLAITATNVPTTGEAIVRGIIKITTAGTIIPSVSLSLAAAAVVSANSYFKISPVSGTSAANITIGNWS